MSYEQGLKDQQARYAKFMASKIANTQDLPFDDSNEAWQFRSVTAAPPADLFD